MHRWSGKNRLPRRSSEKRAWGRYDRYGKSTIGPRIVHACWNKSPPREVLSQCDAFLLFSFSWRSRSSRSRPGTFRHNRRLAASVAEHVLRRELRIVSERTATVTPCRRFRFLPSRGRPPLGNTLASSLTRQFLCPRLSEASVPPFRHLGWSHFERVGRASVFSKFIVPIEPI